MIRLLAAAAIAATSATIATTASAKAHKGYHYYHHYYIVGSYGRGVGYTSFMPIACPKKH